MKRLRVAIIGATGSVGSSVLDICARFPERFEVVGLAAESSADRLLALVRRYNPRYAYLKNPERGDALAFESAGAVLFSGSDGLASIAGSDDVDHIVFASSGTDAIAALQCALAGGKDVSLANKESIVVAGPWVMPLVKRPDQLRPVDSEHSAIWQCLREEPSKRIGKILLTASGGPFREWTPAQMKQARPADALKHPVWSMGRKITIDSATLMNKGIECIEAMQLFGQPAGNVSALIHPRSLVHGMVTFTDATMKMFFSRPDMRLPAAAALAWPDRLPLEEDDTLALPAVHEWALDFYEPDLDRFPCLAIALHAGALGGAYPPLLVGADEVAVDAFLENRLPFLSISNIIERTLERYSGPAPSSLQDAIELIATGKRMATELIENTGG